MSDHYPLPPQAAYIWTRGDEILLGFPPTPGHEKGHTVVLPATASSLAAIILILRSREATAAERQTIGTKAAPTAYDLEKISTYLKKNSPKVVPPKHKTEAPTDISLEDLGL